MVNYLKTCCSPPYQGPLSSYAPSFSACNIYTWRPPLQSKVTQWSLSGWLSGYAVVSPSPTCFSMFYNMTTYLPICMASHISCTCLHGHALSFLCIELVLGELLRWCFLHQIVLVEILALAGQCSLSLQYPVLMFPSPKEGRPLCFLLICSM